MRTRVEHPLRVGAALLAHARAAGHASVAIVGIAKGVGKTVTMRALYEAAYAQGVRVGLVSAGRDGESIDAVFGTAKPRLWLYPGTWIASARETLSRSLRYAERTALPTACGPLEYARVLEEGYYELIGPPTASGLRAAVAALREHCELVLIDGAIDRLAVIATGHDAVVAACGAAAGESEQGVVDEVRALVGRLSLPPPDAEEPAIRIDGVLLPDAVAELIARHEKRQVIVDSPAALALPAKLTLRCLDRLRVRSERSVSVIAVTVASIGQNAAFEPRSFLHAVAEAVRLPTYDIYAGEAAGSGTLQGLRRPVNDLRPGRARLAAALGREAIESDEFIVMRDRLSGDLPQGVRVVRETPTYLLCEIA